MSKPMYQVLMDKLIEQINISPPNTPMMSEREMAESFAVSRMTARRAIKELVADGYLYTQKNKGTFVADEKLRKNTITGDAINNVSTYQMLHYNLRTTTKNIADKLEMSETTNCIRIVRLNFTTDKLTSEKQPSSIDEIYVNTLVLPNNQLESVQFVAELMQRNEDIIVKKEFFPMLIPLKYTTLLKLDSSTPIIKTESTYLSMQGRPYLYAITYNHPLYTKISITT